jgi:hypothetical protein
MRGRRARTGVGLTAGSLSVPRRQATGIGRTTEPLQERTGRDECAFAQRLRDLPDARARA